MSYAPTAVHTSLQQGRLIFTCSSQRAFEKRIALGVCLMVEQSCLLRTQTTKKWGIGRSVWKMLWNGGIQLGWLPCSRCSVTSALLILPLCCSGGQSGTGVIFQSQTASWPLPLAKRTEKGSDVPCTWARLAAERSLPPRRVRITRAQLYPGAAGARPSSSASASGCVCVPV